MISLLEWYFRFAHFLELIYKILRRSYRKNKRKSCLDRAKPRNHAVQNCLPQVKLGVKIHYIPVLHQSKNNVIYQVPTYCKLKKFSLCSNNSKLDTFLYAIESMK